MRFSIKWRNARLFAAIGAVLPWVGVSAAHADPVKVSHRLSVLGPIHGNANGIVDGNATPSGNGVISSGETTSPTPPPTPPAPTPPPEGTNTTTDTTTAAAGGNGGGNALPDSDNELPTPEPNFIIELTSHGASGVGNGAIYSQEDFQPTGTGVFQPFLRIQETGPGRDGTEAGYNTDARDVELDTKDNNHWTTSLDSSSPEIVRSGDTDYLAFRLDVNEQGSSTDRIIWLNKLEIYLGDAPDLLLSNPGGLGDLVYSLDGGSQGDVSVKLDYRLEHGSGSGDMQVLIPVALFRPDRYIYLLSEFSGSDAGFEEWSARVAPNPPPPPPPPPPGVPLPSVAWAGLALLSSTGVVRTKFWRKK